MADISKYFGLLLVASPSHVDRAGALAFLLRDQHDARRDTALHRPSLLSRLHTHEYIEGYSPRIGNDKTASSFSLHPALFRREHACGDTEVEPFDRKGRVPLLQLWWMNRRQCEVDL